MPRLPILARLAVLLTLLVAPACAALGGDGQVDLAAVADQVALVRADVRDVAPMASPLTQEKLAKLDVSVGKLEDALRRAAVGGPISDVREAAQVALSLADSVMLELAPESDARFYVALAKITLRHVARGEMEQVVPAPAEAPSTN